MERVRRPPRRGNDLRILKTSIVVLLIAWGVLALAVRALTPLLGEYRSQLSELASQRLGTPVSIGGLQARWYGVRPLLELRDITLGTAPFSLHVERAELDLAPLELLQGPWPDAVRVTLDGLQLTAVRETSGQIHLEGLPQAGGNGGGLAYLPAHLRLVNTRVVWNDRKHQRPPLPIDDIDIAFDRDGDGAELRARLHTPAGRAQLAARITGRLHDVGWSGESYLEVDGFDVARLLATYLPPYYGLHSAKLDMRSWTRWEAATPVHSQGQFTLRQLGLRPQQGNPLDVPRLASRFTLDYDRTRFQLGLDELTLELADHAWETTRLALAIDSDTDGTRQIAAAADYLRLDDLSTILGVRLPHPELAGAIAALQPRGEVRQLRLRGTREDRGLRWRARADASGIGSEPWDKIPGVDNLSGHVLYDHDRLQLQLDSRDAEVRFSTLFRDPIALRELTGAVDLVVTDGHLTVDAPRISAITPHISTLTRMHFDKPAGERGFLDLQSEFHDGNGAFASRYYPVGIMGTKLVKWLDEAIKDGHVSSGTTLVHGPLADFPFEPRRSGTFQVAFDAQDVQLDYRSGWPALADVDAHVDFHGNQLDIAASAGRVYDSHISQATARIASLRPIDPIRIRGAVHGPLGNALRVLGEDALRPRFGHFAEVLRGSGNSDIDLDFQVPLGQHGEPMLDGVVAFRHNRLSLPDWSIDLADINGRLRLSLDGLSANDVHATLLGSPIRIDVMQPGGAKTRVQARGRFAADTLLQRFAGLPGGFTRGSSEFVVDVDVLAKHAADDAGVELAVSSNLNGIGIDLPAPLGKPTNAPRKLALRIPLSTGAASGSLSYGDTLGARFSRQGDRVDVVLGADSATAHDARGIRVTGHLAVLDAAAWQGAAARLPDAGGGTGDLPVAVDLSIDQLRYDALQLDDVRLAAQRDHETWQGTLQAATLAGRFTVPRQRDRDPVRVELSRLAVSLPHDDAPTPPPAANDGPDPSTLPAIEFDVAEFTINDARLGRLQLRTQAAADGLQVTRLSAQGGQLDVDAHGHWSRESGRFRTQLGGSFSSADIGQLLVDLGYSRQLVDASMSGEFTLDWPGGPAQLHRQTLAGNLTVAVDKGRIPELDPGVTRVVGLLNLSALTRRLRLDFSDFYKKGYSFDSITGTFVFDHGSASTDDLAVIGPTGRIDIRGSTDLVAETFDQKVMVTPNLDATLPIASTIAGGPVAGLAVLVAQKVMTRQVENLNRFDYAVSGSWDQPEVTALDSGGTLSRLLRPFSGAGAEAAPDATAVPEADSAPPMQDATPPPTPAGGIEPGSDAADTGDIDSTEAKRDDQGSTGPLRGVIDFFKSGKPHGSDVPGTGN